MNKPTWDSLIDKLLSAKRQGVSIPRPPRILSDQELEVLAVYMNASKDNKKVLRSFAGLSFHIEDLLKVWPQIYRKMEAVAPLAEENKGE